VTPASIFQQFLSTTPQHVRRHPLRYFLSLISIAVAVMLFVSMRITQESIVRAFQGNLDALAGHAQYRIDAPGGVSEALLTTVEKTQGVKAAPLVQAAAVLAAHHQTIMLWGVDPAREVRLREYELEKGIQLDLPTLLLHPDAVTIPRRLADRFGFKLGDRISVTGPIETRELAIAGILRSDGPAAALDGNILIMEIGAAQRFMGRLGRYDRIEIAVDSPSRLDTLRKALGGAATLEPIRGRNATFDYITSQFQTILVAFSLLASVIGLFIVYNTMSLSIVQRAKEIGTLRALGARRREILTALTAEAAMIGLVASMLGALGGRAVAAYALHQTASTLSIMVELGSPKVIVPTDAWLLAPIVGMLAAVVGAWGPARAAAFLPPIAAMRPAEVESNMHRRSGMWFIVGLAMIASCAVIVRHPRTDWQPTVAGLMAGLFGIALAGPQFLIWSTPLIRRLVRRVSNAPVFLALHNILQNPSRTSLTTVALGGSLSLVIAMASMIGGLDREISRWMDDVLVFDLTMQTNDMASTAYPASSFPPRVLDEVRRDPECAEAYGVHSRLVPFRGDEIMLIAYDSAAVQKGRIDRGRSINPSADRARAAALQSGKVDVSANLARIRGLARGDKLTLTTPQGPRSFEIESVQTDYTWFRGCIFMDLAVYRSLWNDTSLTYLDIRVRPSAAQGPAATEDIARYQARLTTRYGRHFGLFIYRLDQLMDFARRFSREWFALANMQLLLSVIVGGVGVANTLLISVLTQSRQIGLLRAIGASSGQIQKLLAVEALLLGAIGGAAGCLIGLATSRFLVVPMALKASGHVLPVIIPYQAMALAAAASVVIAAPARRLAAPCRSSNRHHSGHWLRITMILRFQKQVLSVEIAALAGLAGCGKHPLRLSIDPAVARPDKSVVLFFVDGMDYRRLHELLAQGRLTTIQRLFVEGGVRVDHAVTSIPAMTYPNTVSLLTGRFPGHHGIVGNQWFDRRTLASTDYINPSLYQTDNFDFHCPTIYEMLPDLLTVSVQCHTHRGASIARPNQNATGLAWSVGLFLSIDQLAGGTLEEVDEDVNRVGRWPSLLTFYFPGVDEIGHRSGSDSKRYAEALENADRQIKRVTDALKKNGLLEHYRLVLVSDHSHPPVHDLKSFDLVKWLRKERGLRVHHNV
jgi:putative ABC transport system permease protein